MLSQPVVLKRFYGDIQSAEDRLLQSFLLPEERHSSGVVAIAFSPDSKLVAYGSYGSTVRLWGSASSAMCITIGSYRALVMVTKFSPDGKLVAFECETRMVRPWDPANGTVRLLSPANGTGQCTAIAFSPNN